MIDIEAISEFQGGWEPLWYMARGHVDKQAFVDAVKTEYEEDVPLEKVEHVYLRNVPQGDEGMVMLLSKKGRGAYPATIIDLWTI